MADMRPESHTFPDGTKIETLRDYTDCSLTLLVRRRLWPTQAFKFTGNNIVKTTGKMIYSVKTSNIFDRLWFGEYSLDDITWLEDNE